MLPVLRVLQSIQGIQAGTPEPLAVRDGLRNFRIMYIGRVVLVLEHVVKDP